MSASLLLVRLLLTAFELTGPRQLTLCVTVMRLLTDGFREYLQPTQGMSFAPFEPRASEFRG